LIWDHIKVPKEPAVLFKNNEIFMKKFSAKKIVANKD